MYCHLYAGEGRHTHSVKAATKKKKAGCMCCTPPIIG